MTYLVKDLHDVVVLPPPEKYEAASGHQEEEGGDDPSLLSSPGAQAQHEQLGDEVSHANVHLGD